MQQQTPLAKLQHRKEWIRSATCEKEQKLNEHFLYLKENAGDWVFTGFSSLLPSKSKNIQKENNCTPADSIKELLSPLNLLNTFSARGLLPIAIEIAQPILITWGFKIAKRLVGSAFTKKKR